MIITVTLNAAIDKTLTVPSFTLGRRHRTVDQRTAAGGKGVNIARTLKALGLPVIATGFAGGATGTQIVEQLTEESILNDFVRIREESRTNTCVIDPTTGEQTEINERGPRVTPQEIELFRDKLKYLARGAAIVVFAGLAAARRRRRHLRDVDPRPRALGGADGRRHRRRGAAPRGARRAGLVSPNVLEAEELIGHEFCGRRGERVAVAEVAALGPHEAIITLHDGCVAQLAARRHAGCRNGPASSRATPPRRAVPAMRSWRVRRGALRRTLA